MFLNHFRFLILQVYIKSVMIEKKREKRREKNIFTFSMEVMSDEKIMQMNLHASILLTLSNFTNFV